MNNLETVRTLILAIGWPVLIGGSVYLFIKGRHVYGMIKGSMVGKITKILVVSMVVEMYSLGIVATAFMFSDVEKGAAVSVPIFVVWFIMFVWSMKSFVTTTNEVQKLAQ